MEINEEKIQEDATGGESADPLEIELTRACIISNLASALDNLSDVELSKSTGLPVINKKRQQELAVAKRRIFDCLVGHASHLTMWEE